MHQRERCFFDLAQSLPAEHGASLVCLVLRLFDSRVLAHFSLDKAGEVSAEGRRDAGRRNGLIAGTAGKVAYMRPQLGKATCKERKLHHFLKPLRNNVNLVVKQDII
jgi:hypothetical protein